MRAIALKGQKQMEVVEIEKPKADGKNVLVKINMVGICGSDLSFWAHGDQYAGLIMGHEFSGTVVDPGELQGELKAGDRVTAVPLDPCGTCDLCKNGYINMCATTWDKSPGLGSQGAYAEYISIRPDMIRKLPDTMSDTEAAMLEPAAVSFRAVKLAQVGIGDKVLITGAGIIGLLAAAWARLAGASYIAMMEVNSQRRENALKQGDVDEVFDGADPEVVAKMIKATNGGFNKFIDCAGVAPALNTGFMACVNNARVVLAGISLEPVPLATVLIVTHGLELMGAIAYTATEFELCIDLIARKKIDLARFVDAVMGFEDAQSAFETLKSGTSKDVKIILKP